jgi:cysteine sulfinate desulfinase/cysteine desulfurase-like protein
MSDDTIYLEHPTVAAPCRRLGEQGWRVRRAGVDERGRVRPSEVSEAVRRGKP